MSETTPQEENTMMYQLLSTSLHVMEAEKHVIITLDLDAIHAWYRARIDVPVGLGAWVGEIEPVLLYRVKEIKTYVAGKKKLTVIRVLHSYDANWLLLKVHKALDPHCDMFQVVEAGIIIDI